MNERIQKLADYLFADAWTKCFESYEYMARQLGAEE